MIGLADVLVCVLERAERSNVSEIRSAFADGKKREVYLRLRNSFVPSISVTYSNPFSIRLVASLTLVAVLHVYSSFSSVSSSCV